MKPRLGNMILTWKAATVALSRTLSNLHAKFSKKTIVVIVIALH
jgi:hypothetical protein